MMFVCEGGMARRLDSRYGKVQREGPEQGTDVYQRQAQAGRHVSATALATQTVSRGLHSVSFIWQKLYLIATCLTYCPAKFTINHLHWYTVRIEHHQVAE